jgi:hypothetical protein
VIDAARLDEASLPAPAAPVGGHWVRRHKLATRLWHWSNAVVVIVMIGSGLTISNAHPHLYWGCTARTWTRPGSTRRGSPRG